MTIQEAIVLIQGRRAGIINRCSARYAETLLQRDEVVAGAVVASISTRKEHWLYDTGIGCLLSRVDQREAVRYP